MREDWGVLKLEDVSKRITKGATPTSYGFDFQNNGINFLKVENVKGGIIDVNSIRDFISIEAYNYLGKSQLESGDILFSIAGTIGNICLVKDNILPANTNQAFAIIKGVYKEILTDFVMWQLKYFVDKIKIKSRGGAMMNVSLQDLKDFQLIISPTTEQRAIVKKLESLFSSLDAGVADLKKAQQQLKIYRQAVLKKAFEGGNEMKLSSCCIKAEKVNRRNIELESSLKYIDIGSIDNKLNKIIGFKEYLWKDAPSRAQQIIKNGDILFSTVRTYLRNIAQVESDIYENEICSSGFTVLRADDTKLLNKYLFHFTLYNGFLDKLGELQTGTSYPAVRDKDVFDQLIPLPSVEEQHQIVKQIESRLSVCDSIEQNIKESLVKAEALRQSILKKAFEGNLLTAQELAECKLAEDYEPASVLLERIKAEQNNVTAKPQKRNNNKNSHIVAKY